MSSELRYDPLKGNWVLIAAHRHKRPFLTHKICPFCKGSEEVPLDYFAIFLPNKFPSLSLEYKGEKTLDLLPGNGICEVIVYTPDHSKQLWDLQKNEIRMIIDKWIKRYNEIISFNTEVEYCYFFENSGIEIGVSLDHPHGQLYAFPIVPPIIKKEMESFCNMKKCVLCYDTTNFIILNTTTVRAIVPFYSKWPYEVHIIPNRHISTLNDLDGQEINDLAEVLKNVLRAFSVLFDHPVPYILAIHQAPHKDENLHKFHFHIEITTPMRDNKLKKFMAGVEEGTGVFINSVDPVYSAKRLKEKIDEIE